MLAQLHAAEIKILQDRLLAWFEKNQRDLPWRLTYSPYHIWISEIMLQQTQMERGVEYFTRWTSRFPDVASIAAAGEEEVLKLWEGLGYYSRARNIIKTARILVDHHGGAIPDDHATLLALPGIGPYTAGAILSLAFNHDYPVVDANVERLFARLFDIAAPIKETTTKNAIWRYAEELLPPGQARLFNQGLMELGALVCQPQAPRCNSCPLTDLCLSCRNSTVEQRPIISQGKKTVTVNMATGVLLADEFFFIQKRPPQGVWANLWEFPGGRIEKGETPEQAVVREYMEETGFAVRPVEKIAVIRHSYMHYRVILHCFHCCLLKPRCTPQLTAAQQYKWVSLEQLRDFAFPAGHRKLIGKIFDEPLAAP